MNEEEEEYQPLDITYGSYAAPEVAVPGRPSEKQDEALKRPVASDSQTAEMYLYDRPQLPIRQEAEVVAKNNGVASVGQRELEQPSLEESVVPRVSGVAAAFPYQTDPTAVQGPWGEIGLEQRSVERKRTDIGFGQGAFEAAKVGSQLPETTQQPFYVNAKQYYRIIKRRYARARLEENIRISRERKPYLHESRHKHAMRRPRGQGGRFLTVAEIEAMKAKESSNSGQSSGTSTPQPDANKDADTQAPVITQQDTSQNKLPPLRKNEP